MQTEDRPTTLDVRDDPMHGASELENASPLAQFFFTRQVFGILLCFCW